MSSAIFCLCACFFPPLLKALWEHSLISVYLFHSLSSLVILCVHLHCSSLPPVFLICMFSSTCWSSVLSHWFMQCYSYKPFSPMLSHCSYLWIIHVYPIFLLSSACRECYLKRLLLACSIHGQYIITRELQYISSKYFAARQVVIGSFCSGWNEKIIDLDF